jgi:hypothetical protein
VAFIKALDPAGRDLASVLTRPGLVFLHYLSRRRVFA